MFARRSGYETKPHQARVDAIVAAARANAAPVAKRMSYLPPPPVHVPPSQDAIDAHLAQELSAVARTLGIIGDRLSDDPILLGRYGPLLQSLDNAMQTLGHLAGIVGAADRRAAADAVPVGELRGRLLRGDSLAAAPRLSRSIANPFAHQ